MIVRELLTRLGFDADNDGARRHQRALMNVRRAAVLASAAAAAAAGTMLLAARQTATAAVETERAARLANASTAEFQRMAAGAGTVGIESEKLSDILKDMNDRVGDFVQTGGGPMLDFFEQIAPKVGITADSFRDLSGPEALQLYVSSLEKANLSQADMVFYMEAIASDSTALLPILQNNGQALNEIADRAERFGAIMSDDVIKAGKDFQTSFAGVQQIIRGLTYTVGEKMLPVITDTLVRFLEWYDTNGEMIRQNVGRFVEKLTELFGTLWRILGVVLSTANDVAQSMGGWEVVMRLVIAALVALTASNIIRGLVGLTGAIRAAGGAALFLRGALMRIPGVLALVAFAAILEDLWVWVNGSESAIGKMIGSWESVKETLTSAMDSISAAIDYLTGKWNDLKASFSRGSEVDGPTYGSVGAVPMLSDPAAMLGMGGGSPDDFINYVNSLRGGAAPNVNTNITMQLPPGTPQSQADFVQQEVVPIVRREIGNAVDQSIRNYQGGE